MLQEDLLQEIRSLERILSHRQKKGIWACSGNLKRSIRSLWNAWMVQGMYTIKSMVLNIPARNPSHDIFIIFHGLEQHR